mmetsp:Transcript_143499/g.458860  ORF Transcript_143499/g.458860 Transcript_143499/m.458860 type:complete len:394 (+) Transcript_143499:149-1330(+)
MGISGIQTGRSLVQGAPLVLAACAGNAVPEVRQALPGGQLSAQERLNFLIPVRCGGNRPAQQKRASVQLSAADCDLLQRADGGRGIRIFRNAISIQVHNFHLLLIFRLVLSSLPALEVQGSVPHFSDLCKVVAQPVQAILKLSCELHYLRHPKQHHRNGYGLGGLGSLVNLLSLVLLARLARGSRRRDVQEVLGDARFDEVPQRGIEHVAEVLRGGARAGQRREQTGLARGVGVADAIEEPPDPASATPLRGRVPHVAHAGCVGKRYEVGLAHGQQRPDDFDVQHRVCHRHAVDVQNVALAQLGQPVLVGVVLVVHDQRRSARHAQPLEAPTVHPEPQLLGLLLIPLPRDARAQRAVRSTDLGAVREQDRAQLVAHPPHPSLLISGVIAIRVT